MEFGYFTLSDNHYENNTRSANTFVSNITDEALYAEQLGMHSAWIGEHHFNSLGVLSCPDLVLSYIAARTSRIRLAPAVTVLPLHHPIRVAEQWATLDLLSNGRVDFAAGRGYDRREYEPFHVDFDDNQGIFEEGLEAGAPALAGGGRRAHLASRASTIPFKDVRITPKPVQKPIPTYVASFSKPSIELAARLGCGLIVAPVRRRDELRRAQAGGRPLHETCAKHGKAPGRLMCSYFTHFADTPGAGGGATRAPDPLLQGVRDPGAARRPEDRAAELSLFRRYGRPSSHKVKPEDLTENSVLIGSSAGITETLKKVEAAGFSEVILYFNVGLKPHTRSRKRWSASCAMSHQRSTANTSSALPKL